MRQPLGSILLVALTALGGRAGAESVLGGSLESDLETASFVVEATIGAADEIEQEGLPFTVYQLEAVEVVKGEGPPPTEIRLLGGRMGDGRTVSESGTPRFARSERVLLFLEHGEQGFRVFRGETRAYRLKDDGTGRDRVVHRSDGTPVVGLDDEESSSASTHWGAVRAGAFKQALRRLARGQ